MGNVFFTISFYIFMRAFEVLFVDHKDRKWYKLTIKIIAIAVLYSAFASMIFFYFNKVHLLGFDPAK
jgi:hypothetical protein